jgi:hypothetical protein
MTDPEQQPATTKVRTYPVWVTTDKQLVDADGNPVVLPGIPVERVVEAMSGEDRTTRNLDDVIAERDTSKTNLREKLPLTLPQPCPICGAKVVMTCVTEWLVDNGIIVGTKYECETAPDVDSDEWWPWHNGHVAMPYLTWLPWENKMTSWLNEHHFYRTAE